MKNGYRVNPSSCDVVGRLQVWIIIIGPSGSGNTAALHILSLEIDNVCFEHSYFFSPCIDVEGLSFVGEDQNLI